MYSQRFALSLEVALQLPNRFFNLIHRCHLSATAYLLYHSANRLSTTFFIFFCFFFQKLLLSVLLVLRDNSFIISCIEAYVNNFFRKKIEQLISSNKAEKEGFEPSRRLTRPIPLAGAPLRPLEYFSRYFLYKITSLRDALFILLKTVLFVNLFFNFYYISDANFLIDVSYRLFPS